MRAPPSLIQCIRIRQRPARPEASHGFLKIKLISSLLVSNIEGSPITIAKPLCRPLTHIAFTAAKAEYISNQDVITMTELLFLIRAVHWAVGLRSVIDRNTTDSPVAGVLRSVIVYGVLTVTVGLTGSPKTVALVETSILFKSVLQSPRCGYPDIESTHCTLGS